MGQNIEYYSWGYVYLRMLIWGCIGVRGQQERRAKEISVRRRCIFKLRLMFRASRSRCAFTSLLHETLSMLPPPCSSEWSFAVPRFREPSWCPLCSSSCWVSPGWWALCSDSSARWRSHPPSISSASRCSLKLERSAGLTGE